jgi:hypothetical protein
MKMSKWPYWLVGGILFTSVAIVWVWVGQEYIDPQYCTPMLSIGCHTLAILPVTVFPVVFEILAMSGASYWIFITMLAFLYFLIGAIIGLIYGKIKHYLEK